jgi:ubiquinol-cytochrome c reductase cytochrome c subunit
MKTLIAFLSSAVAGLTFCSLPAHAQDPKAQIAHGYALYMTTGCYQCHGVHGEGSVDGPRIAPDPPSEQAILGQLRAPIARMPIYTAPLLPDADIHDILVYLRSIGPAKPVDQIPILNR